VTVFPRELPRVPAFQFMLVVEREPVLVEPQPENPSARVVTMPNEWPDWARPEAPR
jgi:hypothetical protein